MERKTMASRLRTFLLLGGMATLGCDAQLSAQGDLGGVPFSSVYGSILAPGCARPCHTSRTTQETTFYMDDEESAYHALVGTRPTSTTLPYVAPGDRSRSLLYLKITGDPSAGARMPLGSGPLAQPQIDAIATWIDQGANN
jgi:hypothetical protein